MLVLFKNVRGSTGVGDVAVRVDDIIGVASWSGEVAVSYRTTIEDDYERFIVNLPIEQVVGLINQAMGAVAVPDAPEKSVVVIAGKDAK